jgi:multidrug efflux pump subunit AcrB
VTLLSLRNPIAVLMACIALVVFAMVVTPRMSVDTFPELTPPVLVVGTLAPGLGPKDVEKTITWRIEKYVSATPGVEHVESASRNNLSVVYVWLQWGTDLNSAQTLVQQQVAFAMSAVPKSLGVLPPFVLQYDPSNAPVVQVTVTGGGLSGPQLYDFALNHIEPVLEGIPGVASASLNGGRQRQINVLVDAARAQARNVTTADVAAAVGKANALLPSGEFINPRFDANVYTNAVAARVPDIGEAAIRIKGGKAVLIRDVAKVEDGGQPETQAVAVNGQDAVYLNVLRVPGGNTLQIVDAVQAAVRNLKGLPPGLQVKAIFDQSTFVRTSYHGLKKEIIQALLLIAIVILIFLQDVRAVIIAATAIPISFAVILIVLYATGQTLNAFTLGGLTLAMGPLIDISVVVLEAVHRRRKAGASDEAAALAGANSVAAPTFAATITTVAVLLPVLLLFGLAKKLFAPLALTVATAMFAGYFVSMLVTPVACRYFLGHKEPGPLATWFSRAIGRVVEGYAGLLRNVLRFRLAVIVGCLVLVAASVFASMRLPSTFFPEIDESMERVYVRLAAGTSLHDSAALMNEMGRVLKEELPKGTVDTVLTNVGSPANARSAMNSPNAGPHMGFIRLELVGPEERALSQRELADKIREILNRRFPGVETLQWPGGLVASVFANGYIAPLVVEVRGDNLAKLEENARAVAEVARGVPGLRDIYPSLQLDYPEVRVETDRQSAALAGIDARGAAQATLEATLGNINTPSVWVDGSNGQSYYVVTSLDAASVPDPDGLARVPVRIGEHGAAVTLGAYGTIRRSTGPIAIERNQLERAAHVLMQTEGRDIGSTAADLEARLRSDPRTRNIKFEFVGQVALMHNTFAGLGVAIGLAIMLVFMIMATQFKSLKLPFVMLMTIPCTLIGIVMALMAAGQGFSVTALMGILMVVGIAVSNGILLVDHAAVRMKADGLDKFEAIIDAGRTRFVPIVMTSLATVIGLIPTALGLEAGTEANRPLALVVVGGLTSSTVLSLFLVPVIFLLIAPAKLTATEAAPPVQDPAPQLA